MSDRSGAWATRLHPTHPSVLNAGRGEAWWWIGGPVVATPTHLWWFRGGWARPVELAGVVQVFGPDEVRTVDDSDRSAGYRASEGYLYRRDADRTECVAVLSQCPVRRFGPGGALLTGTELLTRGAAPRRALQPLPVALMPEPLRWSADGQTVAGLDSDGDGVTLDLVAHRVSSRHDGLPVASDCWLSRGTLRRRGRVVRAGVAEHSCALDGTLLAGPGGVVWDLGSGRRCFDAPRLALGVTVATPAGFVTIDWETHRGHTVDASGLTSHAFTLPLDPDDTVVAGIFDDGAVYVETALGEGFRVVSGQVVRSNRALPSPARVKLTTPLGPLEAAGTAVVDGRRFVWTEDGWLWAYSEASKVR